MTDSPDSYETFGPSVERPAWSWSYLRKPTVLFLWLACAAVCAFLADRKQQRWPHELARPVSAPGQQAGLHIVQDGEQATAWVDRDEDVKAA